MSGAQIKGRVSFTQSPGRGRRSMSDRKVHPASVEAEVKEGK